MGHMSGTSIPRRTTFTSTSALDSSKNMINYIFYFSDFFLYLEFLFVFYNKRDCLCLCVILIIKKKGGQNGKKGIGIPVYISSGSEYKIWLSDRCRCGGKKRNTCCLFKHKVLYEIVHIIF